MKVAACVGELVCACMYEIANAEKQAGRGHNFVYIMNRIHVFQYRLASGDKALEIICVQSVSCLVYASWIKYG